MAKVIREVQGRMLACSASMYAMKSPDVNGSDTKVFPHASAVAGGRLALDAAEGTTDLGTDADIVVFDPQRVIDKATFEKPAQFSLGFRFVLVEGTLVVRDDHIQEGVAPGQSLRAHKRSLAGLRNNAV